MGHSRGSKNPLFNVWVASDFNCSECRKYLEMFEALFEKYGNKIRFNFTHLSAEITLSSVVAESSAEQDKFWEMHDLIFRNTSRDTIDFLNLGERIGVDKNRLLKKTAQ
jgi:protein-disulfide isomerase